MQRWSILFALLVGIPGLAGLARADSFTVNSTLDEVDSLPGDHACLS